MAAPGPEGPRGSYQSSLVRVRAAFDDHRHAEPRPKRDERPRFHPVSGHESQAIELGKRRDDEMRFDQRELIADALSWPGAEGQVHEFGAIGAVLG